MKYLSPLFVLTIILLSSCAPVQNTEEEFNQSGQAKAVLEETYLLEGTWVSVDDPLSVIEFSTIEKSDYYDGKFVNSGPFTLSFSNDEPKDDQITLSVYSDDDTFNYSVVSLTELELELIYLPRGNTLKYVRKDEANE